jgi:hypothetical protein
LNGFEDIYLCIFLEPHLVGVHGGDWGAGGFSRYAFGTVERFLIEGIIVQHLDIFYLYFDGVLLPLVCVRYSALLLK